MGPFWYHMHNKQLICILLYFICMVISICKCSQCHQKSGRQVWSRARQWVGLTAWAQAFLGTDCGLVHRNSLRGFSRVRLFVIPWTIAHQAPPSMELSRQEYQSGLPFPTPGDLPNPGIQPKGPVSLALAGGIFTTSTTWEATVARVEHLSW